MIILACVSQLKLLEIFLPDGFGPPGPEKIAKRVFWLKSKKNFFFLKIFFFDFIVIYDKKIVFMKPFLFNEKKMKKIFFGKGGTLMSHQV